MTTTVDAPASADDVQLLGSMVGSGYRTPPSLVRRGDGQVLQLTPLLFEVLAAVNGQRSCAEIAERVSGVTRRRLTSEGVATLIDQQLRPLGLLKLDDGSVQSLRRSNPILGLRPKISITDPTSTRRLTDPFRFLFRPFVVAPVVLGFAAVVWWVFFRQGLAPAAYDAFHRPHLLLLVFGVTVLSGGFHEFGHAAAARYGGAVPGAMGAGLYLVWPAFYTDVTDSYRLDRRGRLRTDLGGLYFNALAVVLVFLWWWATGWTALLLLVATQVFQMVQQVLPLLRFDGYHVLADLAGVPDLYHRIRPTLLGLLPHRWNDPQNGALKPGARAIITFWVLVTVPLMAAMLLAVVTAVPRLLGTAAQVISEDTAGLGAAWRAGGVVDASARVLEVLGVVLPLLGCILILGRTGLRSLSGLARWSRGSAGRRTLAAGLCTAVATTLSWVWWPGPGTYEPIGPDEKGLLSAVLPAEDNTPAGALPAPRAAALPVGAAAEERLATEEPLQATFPSQDTIPTQADPQLAMVLIPSQPDTGGGTPTATPDGSAPDSDIWVFPFDKPLPPEEGDNQALAVNTEDGGVSYDVAFAFVWATDDRVMNVNEAHAYASCDDCVTVAVAFQVVVIVGDAQVVAPQNLAVAANYECFECTTVAIARQLVLTVSSMPGEEELRDLAVVWNELAAFAQGIASLTLTEITAGLEEFQDRITTILGVAPLAPSSPTASATSPSSSPSTSPWSSPSTSPSPSPSPAPEQSTSPEPSTSSSAPSPSSSPSSTGATLSESPTPTEASTSATPSPSTESSTDAPVTASPSPEATTTP